MSSFKAEVHQIRFRVGSAPHPAWGGYGDNLRGGREREETVIKGRGRGQKERKGKERSRKKEEEREGREGEEVCSRNFQLF